MVELIRVSFTWGGEGYLVVCPVNSIIITLNGQKKGFYRDIHSDRSIIEQNFTNKVYLTGMFACGRDIQARYRDILASGMKPVIVDCGTNIGTSLLHFLGNIRRCMW